MPIFKSSLVILLFTLFVTDRMKPSEYYKWKYSTTAHRLLQLEEDYSKGIITDRQYKILDDLIDSAKERLGPYLQAHSSLGEAEAKVVFETIDSVLTEQFFIVCILMDKLSDALRPRQLNQLSCTPYLPGYRREFCQKNQTAQYYSIDCDLGAFLYISIGEVLGLPLHVIEVPGHNFVRRRFTDQKYMNWDNNSGNVCTDDDFRKGLTPTIKRPFNIEAERRCHFLTDMDQDDITGYYLSLIAIGLSKQHKYAAAEDLYVKSVKHRPYDAFSLNNLSWMYLTVPAFKSKANYQKAYELSVVVDSLLPDEIEYRDTYSCACAGVGYFQKAIQIEKTARNKPTRIEGYKRNKSCLDQGETIW